VDYPEYAWLLFGRSIPKGLDTPTDGGAGGSVTDTASATQLVTNVSDLRAGDRIIIAALNYDYALSAEQRSANRKRRRRPKAEVKPEPKAEAPKESKPAPKQEKKAPKPAPKPAAKEAPKETSESAPKEAGEAKKPHRRRPNYRRRPNKPKQNPEG
jgi:outer membrane biosynthesis protein TonB